MPNSTTSTQVSYRPHPTDPSKQIRVTTTITKTVSSPSRVSMSSDPVVPAPVTLNLDIITSPTSQEVVDKLIQLRNVCGWGANAVPQWLKDADNGKRVNFLVRASVGSEKPVIGMISLILEYDNVFTNREEKKAMVASLCILKEWEGRGYGKQAVLELEKYAAKELGIREMTLETAGEKLIRMYQKLGYTEFQERRKLFYSDSVASFSKKLA
ncbi:hypothetical protein HDU79_009115 [Rhizoclosmatium sp. JEL0117]|nr:hypothetical protein HDU79_009115 [Rhizoclosmatium sp. JEL0117]